MITGHLPELIIVLVLALIVFGPKRLPEIGGSVGGAIRSFKKSISDFETGHSESAPALQPVPVTTEESVPVVNGPANHAHV